MDWRKDLDLSSMLPTHRSGGALRRPRVPRGRQESPRELIGLEIGAAQLVAARIVNNGSKELAQLVREPLAQGLVSGGEVRDPAGLGAALEGFFERHDLPRRSVRLGLANNRIGVRTIEVSGIDDESQLANAIGFRAHELLGVSMEEAVIDYQVLSSKVGEDGTTTRRILIVVAYRDSVDRYLAATDQAGLELVGIDLEAFALLRALAAPAGEGETAAAIVAVCIGHERTTLAISDGHVCEFTRVLEWGGTALNAALARALRISPLEAEGLKRTLSFDPGAPTPAGLTVARTAEALEAFRLELQTLVRELLSSLRFYQAQPGSLPIGELLASGGSTDMPGFAAELERELGVRVRVADPLARVELADSVERPEALGSLVVAIGLGIEDS